MAPTPTDSETGENKKSSDFILVHVNTILAIGVMFNFLLLSLGLPLLKNFKTVCEYFGSEIPFIAVLAIWISYCWFIPLVLVIAEIPAWIFFRRQLTLVYINALLLIISSSLSLFCFLVPFGPFFEIVD